ncbi:MAG: hypothetical protein DLM64_07275 [Solirubrobacterales bacterium]|nr:MAG: hypothetical protein DLM64_07275 [Solirubrobacterales bacterium]
MELDGYEYHQGRDSFERDRDADNLAAGLPTVRVTWERMRDTPGGRPPGRDSPERMSPNRADEPQTYAPLINLSRASDRRMLY